MNDYFEKNLWPIYSAKLPDFLEEFANTPAIQRLKLVGMNCGVDYTDYPSYNKINSYSRYDHSVGVALIVWHFTGDIAQTVAGLFHDIATPVFAHVIDFMQGDYLNQESTEKATELLIKQSEEIQSLLKKYQLKSWQVADYHLYPIADNDTPKLSADRLEYSLGNLVNFKFGSVKDVREIYQNLLVVTNEEGNTELAFNSPEIAFKFTKMVIKNSWLYVADADRFAMEYLARLVKQAIDVKALDYADLYSNETQVINKITMNKDLSVMWNKYRKLSTITISKSNPHSLEWYKVDAKKRYINPLVATGLRVSEIYPEINQEINEFVNYKFDYWVKGE